MSPARDGQNHSQRITQNCHPERSEAEPRDLAVALAFDFYCDTTAPKKSTALAVRNRTKNERALAPAQPQTAGGRTGPKASEQCDNEKSASALGLFADDLRPTANDGTNG
jgi:hypothetical protein